MSSEHFGLSEKIGQFSACPLHENVILGGRRGGEFKRGVSSLLGRGLKGVISEIMRIIDPRKRPRRVAGTLVNKFTKKNLEIPNYAYTIATYDWPVVGFYIYIPEKPVLFYVYKPHLRQVQQEVFSKMVREQAQRLDWPNQGRNPAVLPSMTA